MFRRMFGLFDAPVEERAVQSAPVFEMDISETDEDSAVQDLLGKMARNWSKKAMVRKRDLEEMPVYDCNYPDFLEELLPFAHSTYYQSASEEMKSKILTCGWLIYNEKTLSIESDIITPACDDIVRKRVPGLTSRQAREVAAETAVDESFHSLLVLKANNITKEARGIDIDIPVFNLVKNMNRLKAEQDAEWKEKIIHVSTAIVSEIFISDYLKKLSDDHTIQPLNRMTVYTHRVDEISHGAAFKLLAKEFYSGLTSEQKDFFCEVLPQPITWFASRELEVWQNVLTQVGFKDVQKVIEECRLKQNAELAMVDYSGIVELASEIGITSNPIGLASFQKEGIISDNQRRLGRE